MRKPGWTFAEGPVELAFPCQKTNNIKAILQIMGVLYVLGQKQPHSRHSTEILLIMKVSLMNMMSQLLASLLIPSGRYRSAPLDSLGFKPLDQLLKRCWGGHNPPKSYIIHHQLICLREKYRKIPYFMGKSVVSCRFSLKSTH